MSIHEQTKISNLSNTRENYIYKVSVIVPCYNTKPWLDECLQSLVDQTLQDIEIICINDGSTDGTGARLDEWQTKYPSKIKVIHQANSGPANARNAGIAIAQGECIGFVDSDDFIDTNMYEKLYQVLSIYNADVVKCDYLKFTKQTNLIKKSDTNCIILLTDITKIFNTSILVWDALYKKKFLLQYNIRFEKNIFLGEDYLFSCKLATCMPKLYKIEDKLYFYRQQRKEQLTSCNEKKLYDVIKIFTYLQHEIYTSKLDNITLLKKLIIKKQLIMLAISLWNIQYKYKKDFLFKASNLIFNNNKTSYIYKTMLFAKYKNPVNYLFAPMAVILFHSCYLWQNISLKNIKNYFINKFN